jgi:hypothetical protein
MIDDGSMPMDRLVAIAAVALRECDREARAMREEEVERPDPLAGLSLRVRRLFCEHLQRDDLRTADDRHYAAEQAYIQLLRRREGLDYDKDWAYKIRPLDPYSF